MSVVSKNPFELLGDDEDRSSSPAPKVAKAAPTKEQPKVVPGAAAKGGRGAPRAPRAPRDTTAATTESFDGERVAAPKKAHTGRDRHTRGPREDRPPREPRAPRAAGARGPKTGGRDGAPRAPAQPTGEEGKADLTAETQGEKDGAEAAAAPEAVEAEEAEEEDNSKTLEQYFKEKASLTGALAPKAAREVSAEGIEGKAFEREEIDSFFTGKAKASQPKEAKAKKEKVYIAVDGQFRADRPPRADRDAKPRGGARGGKPARGAARPAQARAPKQAVANINDESAFPSLA